MPSAVVITPAGFHTIGMAGSSCSAQKSVLEEACRAEAAATTSTGSHTPCHVILSHVPTTTTTTDVSVAGQVSLESFSSVASARGHLDDDDSGYESEGETGSESKDSKVESLAVVPMPASSELSIASHKRRPSSLASRDPIKKRKVLLTKSEFAACHTPPSQSSSNEPVFTLLAQPDDTLVLSPLHTFIRQQIEVFLATEADIALPSPGRKNAIQKHQVGLRCIHCRQVPFRDRVKRAVCYPTSVARIYHSVNDMKFDHFKSCNSLPEDVRTRLDSLRKEEKTGVREKKPKRSGISSSTAQYYHDAACKMGMVDSCQGVFLAESDKSSMAIEGFNEAAERLAQDLTEDPSLPGQGDFTSQNLDLTTFLQPQLLTLNSYSPFLVPMLPEESSCDLLVHPKASPGSVPMSNADDKRHLNAFHCFVRRHIELFEASEQDVASPCPGRKARIHPGQVGLRCMSCAGLPASDRVKRSVCYPPSVKGVYHAVSNMKFDHFAICRGLSAEERAEFDSLRAVAGRKRSSGSPKITSCSTARYYYESAVRLGLVDTKQGIRFLNKICDRLELSTSKIPQIKESPQEPVGLSALMMAATDPSLQEAFKKIKAV